MVVSPDDAQIVAAIRLKEDSGIRALEQRFRSRIEAFARKRRVPVQDCPDIAQEVVADAVRQIQAGSYREAASLGTWIHRIMIGKVADYWRKNNRGQVVALEDVPNDHALMTHANEDDVVAVRKALAQLAPADQLLLVWHDQQGYTLEEIGKLIGRRKSAVAERLAKARDQFRQAILFGGRNPAPKRLKD